MSLYLAVDIESKRTKEEVQDLCQNDFPAFTWKLGDSEYEGFYVSGRRQGVGGIKCWTGEEPMGLTVSLLEDVAEDERDSIMDIAKNSLCPQIGKVLRILEG